MKTDDIHIPHKCRWVNISDSERVRWICSGCGNGGVQRKNMSRVDIHIPYSVRWMNLSGADGVRWHCRAEFPATEYRTDVDRFYLGFDASVFVFRLAGVDLTDRVERQRCARKLVRFRAHVRQEISELLDARRSIIERATQ